MYRGLNINEQKLVLRLFNDELIRFSLLPIDIKNIIISYILSNPFTFLNLHQHCNKNNVEFYNLVCNNYQLWNLLWTKYIKNINNNDNNYIKDDNDNDGNDENKYENKDADNDDDENKDGENNDEDNDGKNDDDEDNDDNNVKILKNKYMRAIKFYGEDCGDNRFKIKKVLREKKYNVLYKHVMKTINLFYKIINGSSIVNSDYEGIMYADQKIFGTTLFVASLNDPVVANKLVELGVQPNNRNFHEVILSENTQLIKLFIKIGANVNGVSFNKDYPLALISGRSNKHIEIIQILLDAGANIDGPSEDIIPKNDSIFKYITTPLVIAINENNYDMVKFLIDNGADIKKRVYFHNFNKEMLMPVQISIIKIAPIQITEILLNKTQYTYSELVEIIDLCKDLKEWDIIEYIYNNENIISTNFNILNYINYIKK